MRVTVFILTCLAVLIVAVQPVGAVTKIAQAPYVAQTGPQPGGAVRVTPGGVEQPENKVPAPEQGERVEPVPPDQPAEPVQEPPEQPVPEVEPSAGTQPMPEIPERTIPRIETVPEVPEIPPSTPAGPGAGPTPTTEPEAEVMQTDEFGVPAVDEQGGFEETALPRAGVNLAWVSLAGAVLTGAGLRMRRRGRN